MVAASRLFVLSLAFLLSCKQALGAEIQKWKWDSEQSSVSWLGKKITGQHRGHVRLKHVDVTLTQGVPVALSVVADMKTLTSDDTLPDTWKRKLLQHLQSADFFDTETYPESRFELHGCQKRDPQLWCSGFLKIKNVTQNIEFPVSLSHQDDALTLQAHIQVDRTKWGILYRSRAELGAKVISGLIYHPFDLDITLAFHRMEKRYELK